MKTITIRTACKNVLVATTFDNDQVMVSPLTRCCEGAATGTSAGIVCKGCLKEVPEVYGDCATSPFQFSDLLLRLGCPVPSKCATEVLWRIEQQEVRV